LALALLLYMFALAPYRIELTTHRVTLRVRAPLRILQISDLHSTGLCQRERDVLAVVHSTKPDLIVVTGDSVTNGAPCSAAAATLDRLQAPLGVWFVPGNWEYWMAEQQGSSCLCPSKKVRCLQNRAERIRDDLWIAGLDDLMEGSPSPTRALASVPADSELILLAHEPTAMDRIQRRAVMFAGHTHGGQICLPWLGPLALPPESGKYVSGWYRRGELQMYVSRGVGTSVIPARLWCGPEVALFEVFPD
jgi:uncharacterized protein